MRNNLRRCDVTTNDDETEVISICKFLNFSSTMLFDREHFEQNAIAELE